MATTFVLSVLVLVIVLPNAESCGPDTGFPTVNIQENATRGWKVMNITAEDGVTWTLRFKESREFPKNDMAFPWLNSALRLNLTTGTDQHYVILGRQMDLEMTYIRWNKKLSRLEYDLTCTDAAGESKSFNFVVNVVPVDEYTPTFVNGPYNLTLREDASLEIPLMTLIENATDKDVVPDSDSDIRQFTMKPLLQPGQTETMAGFFRMDDEQKGIIRVDKSLDFEAFPDPKKAFMKYQLTVYDSDQLTNSTTLTIHVTDVDDELPEFYHADCDTVPCDVIYICEVPSDFTGPITNMTPAAIVARDRDSMKHTVTYRMRTGPPRPKFRKHLSMDANTGQVTVTAPLAPYEKDKIVIIIQATEISRAKQSVETTLEIYIRYPQGHLFPHQMTSQAPNQVSPAVKDPSKTIVVAAVGLGTFILIIFIGVCVMLVYMKKRAEKPIYPASDAGDEADDDTTDTPVTTVKAQRVVSRGSSDSGQFSMQQEGSSTRPQGSSPVKKPPGQKRAPGGPGGVGAKKAVRARKAPPGAKGARRIGSARSDTSVGRQSKISIGDIHARDDSEEAMMYQDQMELAAMQGAFPEGMYMDENGMLVDENGMYVDPSTYMDENGMYVDENGMYMDPSMYQDGSMAMAQMAHGAEEDETEFAGGSMQQAPRRPRPPKSAPPGGKRGKAKALPKRPQSGIGKRREEPSNDAADDDEF